MLPIPRPGDSPQDTLKKILWATLAGNFGISSAAEYNTAVQNVVNQGGDPNDPAQIIQSAPSGAASRVGGFTATVSVRPPVATAFIVGDVVAGPFEIRGALRTGVNSGLLQSISVYEDGAAGKNLIFTFWREQPQGLSVGDPFNTSPDLATLFLGLAQISQEDYSATQNGHVLGTVTGLNLPVTSRQDGSLWCCIYVLDLAGGDAFASANSLQLTFGILQD